MNNEIVTLFERVRTVLDDVTAANIEHVLSDPEMRILGESPSRGVVGQLLPTLRARLTNATKAGKDVQGLEGLLSALSVMSPEATVFGYAVVSPRFAGVIYFGAHDRALGLMIVDR